MNSYSKSLKGKSNELDSTDITNIIRGAKNLILENVTIIGSVIDSTTLGAGSPAAVYATNLQTGRDNGTGYDVIFYGQTLGEYLKWDSALGLLNIQGGISVSDSIDFGNLRVSGNTLLSTNTNGNIILDPNGTGSVNIPYNTSLTFGSATNSVSVSNLDVTTISTTSLILDSSVEITDPIITLGEAVADSKDRGIQYNTSSSLGFFGYDATDSYFTYIPNATNTDEVISGALGNAKFASMRVEELTSTGNLTINPGTNVVFDLEPGSDITIPSNVQLAFGDSDIYNDGTDLVIDNPAGQLNVNTNTVIDGDLIVTGNVNFSGGTTTNLTVERINVAGGSSQSPSNGSNVTFVTVTGTGIATGVMPVAVTDGFFKNILMSSLNTGCQYELTFPAGTLVDPVSGTDATKKMVFDTSGQGVQIIWDDSNSCYLITQGGAQILAA